ncbi:hypothetical protein L6164_025777 [Bauhinia variegata]|uniref:Uncharacterized protein n=1 Tax=Bauhinia variegata TaxID=167791 RepID=A0ACB9M338_BAUVA|nr:hypothetical protein L6164_025777 [Bauhinia variegata]
MIGEVQLERLVGPFTKNLDGKRLVSMRAVMTRLLTDLSREKASEEDGYFLAFTRLNRITELVVRESETTFFSVAFNCRTFKPTSGEILEGVVYCTFSRGVFLRCGPTKYAFLSHRKMPNYQLIDGENPVFQRDELAKIEMDTVVRFSVLSVKWVEQRKDIQREFLMLASIDGDSLGPIDT